MLHFRHSPSFNFYQAPPIPYDTVFRKLQIELRHLAKASSHEAGYGTLKYLGPARRLAGGGIAELMRREQAIR